MGELYIHNLQNYINKFDLKVFIETGTGKGTGLSHALNYQFNKLYSIEYVDALWQECKQKFNDDRLSLYNTDSITGLKTILAELSKEEKILFWLDAHFPGADFHFNSYDYLSEIPELHKPLREELKLINQFRPNFKDVFIIDDLQIYEDGPFELVNQDFRKKYGENGIDFIIDIFNETHDFHRNYRHQGFLILTPKIG